MAEEAYPFDDSPAATEVQWSRYLRTFGQDGVDGLPSQTTLKVTTTSGLNVSVAAGTARVRGMFYRSDAPITLGLTINGAATARIDRVVLRYDTTTNTATPVVIQGTAAASPVAPTITYTETVFDLPLADFRVEANDTISTVTDRRRFIGREVVFCTAANRPDSQGRPLLAFETDNKRFIYTSGDNVWIVGLGDDTYRSVVASSVDLGTTASTTWDTTLNDTVTPNVSLSFTAPPSGKVMGRIGAYLYNTTADASTYIALRVTDGSGTVVVADGDVQALTNQPGTGHTGASVYTQKLISLTPGTVYQATLRYQVSAGTGQYDNRFLEIQPQP